MENRRQLQLNDLDETICETMKLCDVLELFVADKCVGYLLNYNDYLADERITKSDEVCLVLYAEFLQEKDLLFGLANPIANFAGGEWFLYEEFIVINDGQPIFWFCGLAQLVKYVFLDHMLSDPEFKQSFKAEYEQSLKEIEVGKVFTLDELKVDLERLDRELGFTRP